MARTHRDESAADNVRMGPLAVFTLMVVICLAVLAVLAIATADATMSLSERRATATTEAYLDEAAAQTFVAALDDALAGGTGPGEAIEQARAAALASVPAASTDADAAEPTPLAVAASREGDRCNASFDCGNGRQLDIVVRIEADGVAAIEQWRMTTVHNEEPPMGNLLGSL